MVIIIAVICLFITYLLHRYFMSKYRNLKSPGISLPIIGHSYKLFSKSALSNPSVAIWEIYKKYHRNGVLYMNTFSINSVWIGDFETHTQISVQSSGNNTEVEQKHFVIGFASQEDYWQRDDWGHYE